MLTVAASSMPTSPVAAAAAASDDHCARMDELLAKLRRSMVELILQGDDVTRQMWQMYAVFEEIFGRQSKSKSAILVPTGAQSAKVKQKLTEVPEKKKTATSSPSPSTSTVASSPLRTAAPSTSAVATTASPDSASSSISITTTAATATTVTETIVVVSDATLVLPDIHVEENQAPKCIQRTLPLPVEVPSPPPHKVSGGHPRPQHPQTVKPDLPPRQPHPRLSSNPLLDTIGVLTSNPDSDDSDLDMVYQQLRYRGRHRRPEVRGRAQRSHHHHHFASSDPESIGYAGSNSIDSGYKSLCATPEVSDSLSAPEVRRSASDVSASDSSTTSGRPRSSDECANSADSKSKIKMGTRAIGGKVSRKSSRQHHQQQQNQSHGGSMSDVTLDHLMYLRQSLRKASETHKLLTSSEGGKPPVYKMRDRVTASPLTDEECIWDHQATSTETSRDCQKQGPRHRVAVQKQSVCAMTSSNVSSSSFGASASGASAKEDSSSGFLLSGVEYYDLESIEEFPCNSYVAMLEEKTRCARIQLMSAGKAERTDDHSRGVPIYKKETSSRPPPSDPSYRGRRGSRESPREPKAAPTTDSKLTEAAIRVLEMIEDFRMEEAMGSSASPSEGASYHKMASVSERDRAHASSHHHNRYRSNISPTSVGPHAFIPRFRNTSTASRPVSTGSLIDHNARSDVRSVASYASSAEHHVYEEIMYDLICERARDRDRPVPPAPPVRPEEGLRKPRSGSRMLPVTPTSPHAYGSSMDSRGIRSPKQRSNLYSLFSNLEERRNIDRFLEMEWHLSRDRRDKLRPDFPVL